MALRNAFENLSEEATQDYVVAEILRDILYEIRLQTKYLEYIVGDSLDVRESQLNDID